MQPLTPLELMRLHIDALFTHDAAGYLLHENVPGGAAAPRFFLGRTTEGPVIRFRHDVDDATKRALEAAANDDPLRAFDSPLNSSPYEAILSRATEVTNTWVGPAFCFPTQLSQPTNTVRVTDANADVLTPLLEPWIPDTHTGQPLFAVVVDGQAVSVCCTVRRTTEAHEAGVETVPAFRGRGYAARVVAAWANAVRESGQVPLYSTSWRNDASRAVAQKLSLIQFGNDLHIA
jgi:hypothetical protein